MQRQGSARAALDALPELARRGGRSLKPASRAAATAELEATEAAGTKMLFKGGDNYPKALEQIDDAPPVLSARGTTALLLAEMPLGTQTTKRHFPIRSRIIASLALGVLVIEATQRSGSFITAREAGERGDEVMAIPRSPLGGRTQEYNHLIREGRRW